MYCGCLDVGSTHGPSTRSIFFPSRWSYRPVEGRVEAKRRQRPGPPPATTHHLLAEPGGGPWVNCAWVEVPRGRTVGGRIVKAPYCDCTSICWCNDHCWNSETFHAEIPGFGVPNQFFGLTMSCFFRDGIVN